MYKKTFLLAISICCMLFIASAFAGKSKLCSDDTLPADVWNRHTGFFMEAGIGTNAFYAFLPTGSQGATVGWAVPAAVGYNFFRNIAIEAGFIYSTDLNANANTSVYVVHLSGSEAAKLYIPYIALRFAVPVGKRFSVIFKIGGMYPYSSINLKGAVNWDAGHIGTVAKWQAGGITETGRISGNVPLPFSGIGLTYAVSRKLEINLMYQGAVYVLASGAVLSLGLTYHF